MDIFKIEETDDNRKLLSRNGICGLENMQNTCYINCIIQCMRYNSYLYEYFKENYHTRHLNSSASDAVQNFMCAWRQMLIDFWDNNERIIRA